MISGSDGPLMAQTGNPHAGCRTAGAFLQSLTHPRASDHESRPKPAASSKVKHATTAFAIGLFESARWMSSSVDMASER